MREKEINNCFGDVGSWLLSKYRDYLTHEDLLDEVRSNPENDLEGCGTEILEILNDAAKWRIDEPSAITIMQCTINSMTTYIDLLDHPYGESDSNNLATVVMQDANSYKKNAEKWICIWTYSAFTNHFDELIQVSDFFEGNPLYDIEGNGRPWAEIPKED